MSNKRHSVGLVFAVGIALSITAVLTVVGTFSPKAEPSRVAEVQRGQLELRDGVLHLRETGAPFSGVMVEHFPDGTRSVEVEIRDGRAHGVSRSFYEDGQVEVEERFVDGVSHGMRTRWYRNGRKRSQVEIVEGVLTGPYRKWHENGTKAAEMTMSGGKADGVARSWHESGNLMSRVELRNGEILDREFYPDVQGSEFAATP